MKTIISFVVFAMATTAAAQQQQGPSLAQSTSFVSLFCTAKANIEANVPLTEVANVLQMKDQAISLYTVEGVGLVEAATEVVKKGLAAVQTEDGNKTFMAGYSICNDVSATIIPLVLMATELGGRCVDSQDVDVDFTAIITACTAFSDEVVKLQNANAPATTQP